MEDARRRFLRGERPLFHATWNPLADVGVELYEVRIRELPGLSMFVNRRSDVPSAARRLIAPDLRIPADAFDVVVEDR